MLQQIESRKIQFNKICIMWIMMVICMTMIVVRKSEISGERNCVWSRERVRDEKCEKLHSEINFFPHTKVEEFCLIYYRLG